VLNIPFRTFQYGDEPFQQSIALVFNNRSNNNQAKNTQK